MSTPLSDRERAQLHDLFAGHDPQDPVEREHLAFITDFCGRHANPFLRTIEEGHLTGSAFILDPAERVLLTHHRRLDMWLQLGGHAEGERVAHEVAMREAREESGLDDLAFHRTLLGAGGTPLLLDVDVHEIPARKGEPAHLHLDLRFLLTTNRPERIARSPEESHALQWLALDAARTRGDGSMQRAFDRIGQLL